MQNSFIQLFSWRRALLCLAGLLAALGLFVATARAASADSTEAGKLVTVYDRGEKRVVLTQAATVKNALASAGIAVSANDAVEPRRETELTAANYVINVYRARPVTVVDGAIRQKVMTSAQSAKEIVAAAGSELREEDDAVMTASRDITADGMGVVLTIDRATPFKLTLYGKPIVAYTQEATVADMLRAKGVKLAPNDSVSVPMDASIAENMAIEVWREGVQTATVEEDVAFPVRIVQDADRPVGYAAVKTPGIKGKKDVVYEITAKGGKEVARSAIQSVVTKHPVEEVRIIGTKPGPKSLTKSKGAQYFVDSKGVSHRETYYDLPMNVVIGACGGGGYTVRVDGAKVDKDGYILVAANYGNYPKCSVVETSMGLGKVYDTGGFAAKHPHGFDLATDWTKGDGR